MKALRPEEPFFILGGTDNEMEEIKKVLYTDSLFLFQPQTNWGDIKVKFNSLPTPAKTFSVFVFIECRPMGDFPGKVKIIDHHGLLSKKPASLLQLLKLLGKKPTLRQKIIASIDSQFLRKTMRKFPKHQNLIYQIWESGYKKKFATGVDWDVFKNYCLRLWKKSKAENNIGKNTIVVWNSPDSMTYLAALADLESFNCLLVSGSPTTYTPIPVLFQGKKAVVEYLTQLNQERPYWGQGYFGCRAIPSEFVTLVKEALRLTSPIRNPGS